MTKPELDPERLARVKAAITRLAAAQDARKSMKPNTPEWTAHRRVLAAACDPAFLLSLIEAAEDTKRLEWLAESATSISDGYGPDGISMDPAKATHGRVLILQTHLPTVPRETEDWFRAAIDAAIAESNA